MLLGNRELVEIAVTFSKPGDGGVHDVVVETNGQSPVDIWRSWRGEDRILVVLIPNPHEPAVWRTRWFSKAGEIELCGSGAVAAANRIFARSRDLETVTLEGVHYNVRAENRGSKLRVLMPRLGLRPYELPTNLLVALKGLIFEKSSINSALRTVVLEISEELDLSAFSPDFHMMRTAQVDGVEALIVTGPHAKAHGFNFRYFTPWHSLDESPIAMSSVALLGPLWSNELGVDTLVGHQLTTLRPRFEIQVAEEGTWVLAGTGFRG